MLPLTRKVLESQEDAKVYCRIRFFKKLFGIKIIEKLEVIVSTLVNIEVQRIVFVI